MTHCNKHEILYRITSVFGMQISSKKFSEIWGNFWHNFSTIDLLIYLQLVQINLNLNQRCIEFCFIFYKILENRDHSVILTVLIIPLKGNLLLTIVYVLISKRKSFLSIWLHLLKKSLTKNFILCAMNILKKESNNLFFISITQIYLLKRMPERNCTLFPQFDLKYFFFPNI